MVLLPRHGCKAHRNGGFDDHHRVGIGLNRQPDHRFHGAGIEVILLAVVVGGRGDDHEVCVAIRRLGVQRRRQVEFLLRQILLDVFVLNGRLSAVDLLHLFREDVHGCDVVMLRQQGGDGQADVSGARDCDVHARSSIVVMFSCCLSCKTLYTTRRTCAVLPAAAWKA